MLTCAETFAITGSKMCKKISSLILCTSSVCFRSLTIIFISLDAILQDLMVLKQRFDFTQLVHSETIAIGLFRFVWHFLSYLAYIGTLFGILGPSEPGNPTFQCGHLTGGSNELALRNLEHKLSVCAQWHN